MTAPALSIFVPGTPRPQGSKRAIPSRKPGGKPIMVEQVKGLADWRGDVRRVAMDQWGSRAPLDGPLAIDLLFLFVRPQSHHQGNDRSLPCRIDAPRFREKTPDASKLQRAVEDALTGIVYTDDARIARWQGEKTYTTGQPGVEITISELPKTQAEMLL